MKKFFTMAFFSLALLPERLFGAFGRMAPATFRDLVYEALYYLNRVVGVIFGLALVVFLWNMFQYVRGGEGDDLAEYRTYILWSVIGLFVMSSVWGIVYVVKNTVFGGY